jgi:hypothetical protein
MLIALGHQHLSSQHFSLSAFASVIVEHSA